MYTVWAYSKLLANGRLWRESMGKVSQHAILLLNMTDQQNKVALPLQCV